MMRVLAELLAGAEQRAGALPPVHAPRRPRPSFKAAIAGRDRISVIAEFKRCSPSRGPIRPFASVVDQVTAYVDGGASALSVLTEPIGFGGCDLDLQLAAAATDRPVVMKDFVVSPRQVEHAAVLGASAVLLIVRCLTATQLTELARACRAVGVTPLVECHDADEIRAALTVEDAVVGINSRDLATFDVDVERARRLLDVVPAERVVVVESGLGDPEAIRALAGLADAVLVGTALMTASDPRAFLRAALATSASVLAREGQS